MVLTVKYSISTGAMFYNPWTYHQTLETMIRIHAYGTVVTLLTHRGSVKSRSYGLSRCMGYKSYALKIIFNTKNIIWIVLSNSRLFMSENFFDLLGCSSRLTAWHNWNQKDCWTLPCWQLWSLKACWILCHTINRSRPRQPRFFCCCSDFLWNYYLSGIACQKLSKYGENVI